MCDGRRISSGGRRAFAGEGVCAFDCADRRTTAAIAIEMFADKIGPSGPAVRSRPRAEGCSFASQAHPLGCRLVPSVIDAVGIGGPQPGAAEARSLLPNLRISAGCSPRANCIGCSSSFLILHFFIFLICVRTGAVARSRPRAEGCSFASQAHPLGCRLVGRFAAAANVEY